MSIHSTIDTYFGVKDVASTLCCSVSNVWRRSKEDPDFPKPIKIGSMTRWSRAELNAYLESAKAEREAA